MMWPTNRTKSQWKRPYITFLRSPVAHPVADICELTAQKSVAASGEHALPVLLVDTRAINIGLQQHCNGSNFLQVPVLCLYIYLAWGNMLKCHNSSLPVLSCLLFWHTEQPGEAKPSKDRRTGPAGPRLCSLLFPGEQRRRLKLLTRILSQTSSILFPIEIAFQ